MENPKINFRVSITKEIPIELDFIETLVKMVDHIRSGEYSADSKKRAVSGLEMVIGAVRGAPREITGTGQVNVNPFELTQNILNRVKK